ncbi:hypothetical protein [Seonamhaeicola sp.]|uniref:hypothetical protein n=1 Tax=Seonamhaeicola sp. TaxID=1912245 RepID=UPI00260455D8|nr:hypothetical protein [Seonamhaeicola sp.]
MNVKYILLIVALLHQLTLLAHPTGNMIVVGDTVMWPYIDPIDNMQHHACIMSWRKGTKPGIILKSEFSASNFMLSNNSNVIYIIKRNYVKFI